MSGVDARVGSSAVMTVVCSVMVYLMGSMAALCAGRHTASNKNGRIKMSPSHLVMGWLTCRALFSNFADWVVFRRQPDTQVSNTPLIWFPPSPPLSPHPPCQRGLRVAATHSGVVRRRVWGRSVRHRPPHTLRSLSLPRTTRLSWIPPPTVKARPRRTPRKERRRPLRAVTWMDEC